MICYMRIFWDQDQTNWKFLKNVGSFTKSYLIFYLLRRINLHCFSNGFKTEQHNQCTFEQNWRVWTPFKTFKEITLPNLRQERFCFWLFFLLQLNTATEIWTKKWYLKNDNSSEKKAYFLLVISKLENPMDC